MKFNQDVRLSYQGASEKTASANEIITVDGSWSEHALTLDDGNSIILIAQSTPGNFASLLLDRTFDEFPGSVVMPDGTKVERVEPPPALILGVFTGTPLTDDELTDLGIPESYANKDAIRVEQFQQRGYICQLAQPLES